MPSTFAADKTTPTVTKERLRSIAVENPDSVLGILDRMESANSHVLSPFRISLLRAFAYNEKRMFAYVNKYARETLESDSMATHPQERLNALTLLSVSQSFFGDLQGCVKSSTEAMNLARKNGNLPAELNVLTTMAKIYFALDDKKNGYEALESIISKGAESDNARVLANVSAAYGVKIVKLYADDRFDEAMREGQKRLEILELVLKQMLMKKQHQSNNQAFTL